MTIATNPQLDSRLSIAICQLLFALFRKIAEIDDSIATAKLNCRRVLGDLLRVGCGGDGSHQRSGGDGKGKG